MLPISILLQISNSMQYTFIHNEIKSIHSLYSHNILGISTSSMEYDIVSIYPL